MLLPKYEPRTTSDVAIGYLVSLTDRFLQGDWIAIIPLILWTVLAALIWLTIVRKLDIQPRQSKEVVHKNKPAKKSTKKKPKSSKKKKRKRHR